MMNRGNSGVLLMGLYEIQIFDSHPMHAEQIHPDGTTKCAEPSSSNGTIPCWACNRSLGSTQNH